MASADAFTLSVRVPNKTADAFKALADSLGLTTNALIKDMVERAVTGKAQVQAQPAEPPKPGAFTTDAQQAKLDVKESMLHVPRMYGVALTLVDDLMDAGYPESEIENALKSIRREML